MRVWPFEYVPCTTFRQAIDALVEFGDDALVVAGGTVTVPMMKHQIVRPDVVVSLAEVIDGHRIERTGDIVSIGALATHAEVAGSATVRDGLALLATACGSVASPAIRNMGTLGGNIAYAESASDPGPALLALDAAIVLEGPKGTRVIPAREFYRGFYETAREFDEFVVEVRVPTPSPSAVQRYMKWSPRAREDKPLVGLAVLFQMEAGRCHDVRIAVSGAAEVPTLLQAAADLIEGERLEPSVIAAVAKTAAAEIKPFADLQASAGYRREMVEVWCRRLLTGIAEENQ